MGNPGACEDVRVAADLTLAGGAAVRVSHHAAARDAIGGCVPEATESRA